MPRRNLQDALTAIVAAGYLASVGAAAPSVSFLSVLDTSGTGALRNGDPAAALAALSVGSLPHDSAYHLFKLGLALAGTGAVEHAVAAFRQTASLSSLLAPAAYEQIGRIELTQGRACSALAAYRAALAYALPPAYKLELQNVAAGIAATSRLDSSLTAWLAPWFAPAPLVDETVQREVVLRLVADRNWIALDSMLAVTLRAESRREACRLLTMIPLDSLDESALSTVRMFDVATALHSCRQSRLARQWLTRAESRRDYVTVLDPRSVLYLRGMLAYAVGDYTRAIDVLREYEHTYGPTPEVVLTIARAYRNAGRSVKAGEWYDRHIELYPTNRQSGEILWYRAWQKEEEGHLDAALRLYRRIRQQFQAEPRASEAYFREGLLHFRNGRLDSALAVWNRLQKAYAQSPTAHVAAYWQARAYLAGGQRESARKNLATVVRYDPLSFYSYRAQDLLRAIGDTSLRPTFDTATAEERCRRWLDSLSSALQRLLTPQDSLACLAGTGLLAVGLTRQGHAYLEPVLERTTGNLALQYVLAGVYDATGQPTLSYRAARSLGWRIPPEARAVAPRGVLSRLYPTPFAAYVNREAALHAIAPELIWGLIRQESAFDPEVVSPAGAVGLMQLMPSTAAAVAADLGEPYIEDSLRSPEVNVRLGVHYLRQLLDQFDGSIVPALAGYNAGPHNARRWCERNRGQDFDLFVENISYTETRGYVKRVLANYWTYCRLGLGPDSPPAIALGRQ